MLLAAIATVCLAMPAHNHVIDPFRAPPCDRCAGNRGMELATSAGADVRAATTGVVTFAGQVGGRNYVVVRASSDRRVRVTYGGLAALAVARGDAVSTGKSLGTAADTLFFGVRVGDRHVDPAPFTRAAPAANATPHATNATPRAPNATPASRSGAVPDAPIRPRFRITLGSARAPACSG